MGERTKISWCDSTLNPWRGCDKVSAGCANCYITSTAPFRTTGQKHGDPRVLSEAAFKEARRLNKFPFVCVRCGRGWGDNGACLETAKHEPCGGATARREIFSLSLGDWLDPEVEIAWLARWLDTIRQCDQVRFLLLTKRPELFHGRLVDVRSYSMDMAGLDTPLSAWVFNWIDGDAPQHIAIGASVENQFTADWRINALLAIPAHRRFLSMEPLLGPVNVVDNESGWPLVGGDGRPMIHQIIVGGESGRGARPCNVDWIRSIKGECEVTGVKCFVKQLGAEPCSSELTSDEFAPYMGKLELHDKKGADPSEWPEDLRVQERIEW